MKNPIRKAALPVLIAVALLSGSAWAQTAPASAMSTSMAAPSAAKAAAHEQRHMDRVEQQITTLHSQLNITDAQSKQWDAYAQTMRDNAQNMSTAFADRKQKAPTLNADETMKSYADLTQMQADGMKKLSSAWSDVYAVLTPDQKKTADDLFQHRTPGTRPSSQKHRSKPASSSSAAATPST